MRMEKDVRREIEETFNLRIVNEQYLHWGEIYWLQLNPDQDKPERTFSVAVTYAREEQEVHTHPGYEEILYGLEGETVHYCDGRQIILNAGQWAYIREGGQHGILNRSGKPSKFLSIIHPTIPSVLGENHSIEDVEMGEVIKLMNLDAIVEKFSKSVGLAVTLVDISGELLTEPKNFPEFCALCLQEQCGDCPVILNTMDESNMLRMWKCKFGVHSIQSPIIINNKVKGYLGCGYGRMAKPTANEELLLKSSFSPEMRPVAQKDYINLDMIRRNHLKSVGETLSLVSVSLVQLIIQSAREKQINSYKLNLYEEKKRQAELESSLNEVRLKFLESQVNPHFLFNTLNTIAQSAVMEGATTASSLTYALSNLLRSSLGKTDSLISVKNELDHIHDYIYIQRMRFPNRFQVETEVDPKVLQVKIPYMTLMVFVENSIIHGFANLRRKGILKIRGDIDREYAVLQVEDNGAGVPEEISDSLKVFDGSLNMPSLKGIGLKNVYKRLEYFFGDDFSFRIQRLSQQGTVVTVKIPIILREK